MSLSIYKADYPNQYLVSKLRIFLKSIICSKNKIIGLYKSQSFIQTTFDHMYEHEDWLSYDEWMRELNEESE